MSTEISAKESICLPYLDPKIFVNIFYIDTEIVNYISKAVTLSKKKKKKKNSKSKDPV